MFKHGLQFDVEHRARVKRCKLLQHRASRLQMVLAAHSIWPLFLGAGSTFGSGACLPWGVGQ